MSVSVDSKALIQSLSPLDATHTGIIGGEGPVMVNQESGEEYLPRNSRSPVLPSCLSVVRVYDRRSRHDPNVSGVAKPTVDSAGDHRPRDAVTESHRINGSQSRQSLGSSCALARIRLPAPIPPALATKPLSIRVQIRILQ